MIYEIDEKRVLEFLLQSNYIEKEYSIKRLIQANDAWEAAYAMFITEPFWDRDSVIGNIQLIHLIHQRLGLNVKSDFRDIDKEVSIGGKYAVAGQFVEEAMEYWAETHWKASTWEDIKKAHIAFERIHPFLDGNGRVGRILMNIQRLRSGLKLLVIPEKDKYEYYKWFE